MNFHLIHHVSEAVDTLLPSLQHLETAKSPYILAIDGRCASGKTTLSSLLASQLHCPVIHMDDFFLPPHMRTQARLEQPGGNVHRERFIEEVLQPLKSGLPFSYRPFDCSISNFREPVEICPSSLVIIEGSYACHPDLHDFYNLTVFMTLSQNLQMNRILSRNGQKKARLFQNIWIPMEEVYFQTFDIKNSCNMVFKTV